MEVKEAPKGGIKGLALGRKDLFMIDPRELQEEPGWNQREEGPGLDAHVRWLADSIKENGVQEPITVYLKDGLPFITNGHCRQRAALLAISEGADIKAVPVRVEERGTNDADRIVSMITRNGGKEFTSLEKAKVVKLLLGYGLTVAEISKKTSFSHTTVGDLLRLCEAPQAVVEMIRNGDVSPTMATDVLRKEGAIEGAKTLTEAVVVAKSEGKKKATAQHLPQKPAKERAFLPSWVLYSMGLGLKPSVEIEGAYGVESLANTEFKRLRDLGAGVRAFYLVETTFIPAAKDAKA